MKRKTCIGTWKVSPVTDSGKLKVVPKELERLKLQLIGISEFRSLMDTSSDFLAEMPMNITAMVSDFNLAKRPHNHFSTGNQSMKYSLGIGSNRE